MLWSNWQGAIGRGAVLAFLFWAGFAWTQSPTKRLTPDGAERIMVVHENGRSTRCRVVETWQLPDGRMANLLQTLETGELITIVDEPADARSRLANLPNAKAMPKRIFGWGKNAKTPPDGSPVPPHLRLDSGVIVKNDNPPPTDGVILPTPGVTIINQAVDEKALGSKYAERYEGSPVLPRPDATPKNNSGLFPRLFPKRDTAENKPQVIDFNAGSQSANAGSTGVPIVNGGTPTMGQTVTFQNVPSNPSNPVGKLPSTLPERTNTNPSAGPQIVNHSPMNGNSGSKPETANKQPLKTRLKPFGPKEVIEVVPQVNEATAFGPTIVQGMDNKQPQQRPVLGGLWKAPNSTPPSLTAGGQPVLPTTPNLGSPTFNGPATAAKPEVSNVPGPLVVNGSEQPALPTSPGMQPAPASRPVLGGLWKTPNGTASNNPSTPGTPLPSPGMPTKLPDSNPTQTVDGQPSVAAKPVVAGSTPPATRPVFGGLFTRPNPTPAPTVAGGTPAPTKRPIFGGLFKAPTPAPAPTPTNTAATNPTPPSLPGSLPNPSSVAQKSLSIGSPSAVSAPGSVAQQTPSIGTPSAVPAPGSVAQQTPSIGTPSAVAIPGAGTQQTPSSTPSAVAGVTPNPTRPIVGGLWKSPNTTAPATPTVPQVSANALKQPAEKPATPEAAKPWRPGDRIVALFQPKPNTPAAATPKTETVNPERSPFSDTSKPKDMTNMQKSADFLAQQNKALEKQMQANAEKIYKVPFSTAMSATNTPPSTPTPAPKDVGSLAIPKAKPVAEPIYPVAPIASENRIEKPEMFGKNEKPIVMPPGQSLLQPMKVADIAPLPAAPVAKVNESLLTPERFVPTINPNLKTVSATGVAPPKPATPTEAPKAQLTTASPAAPTEPNAGPSWPLGAQSVLAAKSGLVGPVTYIPIPTVTVPYPNNPPAPPAPKMPDAPQLNAQVNGFSPPAAPKNVAQPYAGNPMAMPQNPMMNPYANPMLAQQMMYHQAMMQQQQYAMMQQQQQQYAMMQQYGYRANPYMQQMPQNTGYANLTPTQGPTANPGRYYGGPMPPTGVQHAMAPMINPPPAPQPPMFAQVGYQQQPAMPTQQSVAVQQVEQIVRMLRESPYPAQREYAAQSLTSFDWRAHPQIIPALLQSAGQDPAPNVRASCVNCLGRMRAAVEPVFGTLQSLRSDIDPRVRHEVEVAFTNLGQAPIMPGYR